MASYLENWLLGLNKAEFPGPTSTLTSGGFFSSHVRSADHVWSMSSMSTCPPTPVFSIWLSSNASCAYWTSHVPTSCSIVNYKNNNFVKRYFTLNTHLPWDIFRNQEERKNKNATIPLPWVKAAAPIATRKSSWTWTHSLDLVFLFFVFLFNDQVKE